MTKLVKTNEKTMESINIHYKIMKKSMTKPRSVVNLAWLRAKFSTGCGKFGAPRTKITAGCGKFGAPAH